MRLFDSVYIGKIHIRSGSKLDRILRVGPYLVIIFIRRLGFLHGGIQLRSKFIESLKVFYPNSANWQTISPELTTAIDLIPSELLALRNLAPTKFEDHILEIPQDALLERTLGDAFNKFKSDKTANGYAKLYAGLLSSPLSMGKNVQILEIGIGTARPTSVSTMAFAHSTPGGSLRAFASLGAEITCVGLDINRSCLFEEERINYPLG